MTTASRPLAHAAILLAFLITGVSPSFAGTTLDRIKQSGTVTVGFREESVPFSYKNAEQGAPLGFSIEICNTLIEAIKQDTKLKSLDTRYTAVTGATRIPLLLEGKIDLECGSTTNTKARREQVAFSIPLYFASAKLLVREGSGITRIDDLDGKTLAVEKTTTGFRIVEARKLNFKAMKTLLVDNAADGVKAVETKTADAFITDDILLYSFKAQSKEPLSVVGAGMSIEPLAVMFSKDDKELAALVEREMMNLYKSGQLRKLYTQWFQSTLPQRAINLKMPPNQLASDMFSHPSSYTVDWVIF